MREKRMDGKSKKKIEGKMREGKRKKNRERVWNFVGKEEMRWR